MEKRLTKTLDEKAKRVTKISGVHKEVMDNNGNKLLLSCLMCGRKFGAMSKYNRVCEACKISDRWKVVW